MSSVPTPTAAIPQAPPSPLAAAPRQQVQLNPFLVSMVEAAGYKVDGIESNEELLEAISATPELSQQIPQLLQVGRQVAPYQNQFYEFMQHQQNPQQPAQPEPEKPKEWTPDGHFSEKWKAPAYDPQWEQLVAQGALVYDPSTGGYRPAPGHEMAVPYAAVQGLNQQRTWLKGSIESFLRGNPYKQTWEAFQEPLQRMIQEQFSKFSQAQSLEQKTQNWENQNADLLYRKNGDNFEVDPATGMPVLSPYGQRFYSHLASARKAGITDNWAAIEHAAHLTHADVIQAMQEQQRTRQPQADHQQQHEQSPQGGQPPRQTQAQPPANGNGNGYQPQPSSNGNGNGNGHSQGSFLQNAAMHSTSTGAGGSSSPAQESPIETTGQLAGIIERTARQQNLLPPKEE